MSKNQTVFCCSSCDAQFPKWAGRCEMCGAWGTIGQDTTPEVVGGQATEKPKGVVHTSKTLAEVAGTKGRERITVGEEEYDRVLGGGIVPGSAILLSGEPGVGKSTLVANLSTTLLKNRKEGHILYISGEESGEQLALRFARLKTDMTRITSLDAHPIEDLLATIEKEQPILAIIDSVQTLTSRSLDAAAGSPNMVRYAASCCLEFAKTQSIPLLLIGQVTKDGSLAGPKTLEHLVDVVLTLDGDPTSSYRLLRSTKNRFGATSEIGVFEMTETGLLPVENPSLRFLEERVATPGSVITATCEGSRVFFVEIQALVDKTAYGTPVRRASGIDQNRLQMLIAILSRRLNLSLGDKDVFVNVVGGLSVKEPAADLAVCAAIISALKGTLTPKDALFVGEVGLGGEVRSVSHLERRLKEAGRLGLNEAFVPESYKGPAGKTKVHPIKLIKDLS